MGVILTAYYTKKVDMALGIVRCCAPAPAHPRTRHAYTAVRCVRSVVGLLIPTYYVHNYEVPCANWELGSRFSVAATPKEVLEGVWRASANASRFDAILPLDYSLFQIALLPPGIAITANTSEIYHSGLKLDDPLTKERTHDYLLLSSYAPALHLRHHHHT